MRRKIVPDVVQGQELVHLPPSASLREAAKLMCARNVGSVLVLEGGRLQGIVTKRDMVRRLVAAGHDPNSTTLDAVMTRNPDTIAPGSTALDALRLMQDGGYRHLPVVDGGRVVAIVSRRDFAGLEKAQLDDETSAWERIG